jgi:possible DNA-directed DNA polymerase
MKGISIPDHRIHHAYLVIGQEEDLLRQMAKDFVVRLFHKSKREEPQNSFLDALLEAEEEIPEEPDSLEQTERRVSDSILEMEDSLSLRIHKEEHPDLIFVDYLEKENGEKKSSISIDQIRQEVKGTVDISPKEGQYKVYVLCHSDKMTVEAQNALLKTLEEAPGHVIMILLCENETKLLPTVLSRVVRVYVGDMPIEKQWNLLQESSVLRILPAFLKEIAHKSQEEMQKFAEELGQVDGQELYCFLDIILRDVLCYKSTKDHHLLYGQSARESIMAMAEKYSYWTLGQWGECIERYKEGRGVNVSQSYQVLDFFLFLSNA